MYHVIIHGRRLAIDREISSVGRDPTCDIPLPEDTEASRRHAVLIDLGQKVVLMDLKSSNGTLLNNEPIEHAELNPGDRVTIGSTVLEVEVPAPPKFSRPVNSAGYRQLMQAEDYQLSLRRTLSHLKLATSQRAIDMFATLTGRLADQEDVNTICQQALSTGTTLATADRGLAMLPGADARGLEAVARVGVEATYHLRRNLHQVLMLESMEHNRVVMTRDLYLREIFSNRNTMVMPDVCSAVVIPLVYLGEPMGVFYADRRRDAGAFSDADLRVLVFAAHQAAATLGNLRLLGRTGTTESMVQIIEQSMGSDTFATCEVCGESINRAEAGLVACAKCDTLYHSDCWEWCKRCAIYGCLHGVARPAPAVVRPPA